ncbi:MAG: hypothetical protein ABR920_03670 [Terriglobales bacterium]
MQVLSSAEVQKWFSGFPAPSTDYVQSNSRELFFAHPEASCIDLEYPPKLERLPFFARLLATIGYDVQHFGGAMLWFTAWHVWNSEDEAVGYHVVEAMGRSCGQPVSFEVAPGHLFRSDELTDVVAMLLQPMIFGWDAFYLPRWSYGTDEFFLHVSHDSFVSVVTRTAAFHEKVFGLLKELDLNPQEGHDLQKSRFCRTS